MAVVYQFGPYRLDPVKRILMREGRRLALPPKAFDTLLYLVSSEGRTVGRREIMQALWPNTFVEEGNLNYNISQLRKVLGEYEPGVSYIQTLPKQGYQFIADVSQVPVNGTEAVPQAADEHTWWLRPIVVLPICAAVLVTLLWAIRIGIRASIPERTPVLSRLTSDSGLTMTPAVSPDGKLVAYASDRGRDGRLAIWVQPLNGREPVRLTQGPSDDYSPCFSPDGHSIAFRSEREGGGIYVIPAGGGEARLIAHGGRRPRFSPDGKWIAYWVGADVIGYHTNFPSPGTARMYIVPSAGGQPREVRPEFASAAYPIWTRDGKHLLFLGNHDRSVVVEPTDAQAPEARSVDWWVTPVEGGSAIPTGVNAVLRNLGLSSVSQSPETWSENGAGVLMSAALADTHNLWLIPISETNWKVSGPARRLTFGTTMDVQPSLAPGHQVIFSSLNGNLDVWSVPLEPNQAKVSGGVQRLTVDAFDHSFPTVTTDGTKLAYSARRAGSRKIWVRDLATGNETAVSTPLYSGFGSAFSPDGTKLAYRAVEGQTSVLYIVSQVGGPQERFSENCASSVGWSSDGKRILCAGAPPSGVAIIDLTTKQKTGLLNHPAWRLWNPRFSPDDRWVSFNATTAEKSRIFVAPLRGTGPIPESEWISITNGVWDDKPRWSPDGTALYFMSSRDGFRCIWAQRLDQFKHPLGEAFPIFHAHEARRSLLNVQIGALDMSVARDKILFNMTELTGNLWTVKLSDLK